jgi:hypothetical protein
MGISPVVAAAAITAATAVATTAYSAQQAKKNRVSIPKPPPALVQPNEAPLNLQAIRRARAAAGVSSNNLTGPQGLATAGAPRSNLLGVAA